MNLILGVFLIILGLLVSFWTYVNIKRKKRFSLTGGGFNMLALSMILITIGIYMIVNQGSIHQ